MPVSLKSALLALAGAAALSLGSAAAAEPAMWVVKDADSTVYLFGTIHLLRPGRQWRTPKIDQAFASCQELTLEIRDVDDQDAMVPLLQRYGIDREHPLSSRLSDADKVRLAAAEKDLGVDPAAFEVFRPWLASLQLGLAPAMKAGYEGKAGVERALKADADARHETVNEFENSESQIAMFAALPDSVQLDLLRESLDEYSEGPARIDRMVAAWSAGDTVTLNEVLNEEVRKESSYLYRVLLVDRNQAFAGKIAAMLKGRGVSCVAVGAGHLVGPDSVQAKLQALGIASERY